MHLKKIKIKNGILDVTNILINTKEMIKNI